MSYIQFFLLFPLIISCSSNNKTCDERSRNDPCAMTRYTVEMIYGAAKLYLAENPEYQGNCPDIETLKREVYLDPYETYKDLWGNEIVIRCNKNKTFTVFSFGPDGKEGTSDDIRMQVRVGGVGGRTNPEV